MYRKWYIRFWIWAYFLPADSGPKTKSGSSKNAVFTLPIRFSDARFCNPSAARREQNPAPLETLVSALPVRFP